MLNQLKHAVHRLSGKKPFILLGGNGSERQILVTDFTEFSFSKACSYDFESFIGGYPNSVDANTKAISTTSVDSFLGALVGIVSYDDYSSAAYQPQNRSHHRTSRVFKVKGALVWEDGRLSVHGTLAEETLDLLGLEKSESRFSRDLHLNRDIIKALKVDYKGKPLNSHQGIALSAMEDDDTYLTKVAHIQSEIRSGRYYQLNLLRYFRIEQELKEQDVLGRFFTHSGPQGSIFSLLDESIYSFSPERFVRATYLKPENTIEDRTSEDSFSVYKGGEGIRAKSSGEMLIESWPIKGTRPVLKSTQENQAIIEELLKSAKDNAELHMIIDLMRNDFRRIARPLTVKVHEPGKVESFRTVHHLVGHLSAKIDSKTKLQDFFKCLLPAGSITGAPKVEVMKAIYELERRRRKWFMGSAFYLTKTGQFDSSVLIRTLTKDISGTYEYAAGSGIVLSSNPCEEMAEIQTKCRVMLESIS